MCFVWFSVNEMSEYRSESMVVLVQRKGELSSSRALQIYMGLEISRRRGTHAWKEQRGPDKDARLGDAESEFPVSFPLCQPHGRAGPVSS